MTTKPPADWEAIERAYRAGVLSLRAIAKPHGISETAIRKRAEKEGWERDLSAKVAEKVRSELVRSEVRKEKTANKVLEAEIVDAAATLQVNVVREHRKDITLLRDTLERLMGQVASMVENREEMDGVLEAMKGASPEDQVRLIEALGKRLRDIPAHAVVLKELGNTLKTVIALEREAFNIMGAAEPPPAPGVVDTAKVKELSDRLEALGG